MVQKVIILEKLSVLSSGGTIPPGRGEGREPPLMKLWYSQTLVLNE